MGVSLSSMPDEFNVALLGKEDFKNRSCYPTQFGTWLSDAFIMRNTAQYHFDSPQVKRVRRMANHAKEFIYKVEEVLEK